MKVVFLFLTLALMGFSAKAQCETQSLAAAEKLEAALQEQAAFEAYKAILQTNPQCYTAAWKLSELNSRIGRRQKVAGKAVVYYQNAKNWALAAMRMQPRASEGYYAYSVAMGCLALTGSNSEKLNAVRNIKQYADKAVALDPRNGRAWHVLGKWHYEVSNLAWWERAGSKMYGGLPSASLKESILAYEKARQLEPLFILNNLELAKAYRRAGSRDKALTLLKAIPAMQNRTVDDERIKVEAAGLLKSWS